MIIYLDIDGVLADLDSHINNYLEENPHMSMDKLDDLWAHFSRDRWANLNLYPWARELVEICKEHGELILLTAPSTNNKAACVLGKMDWKEKNFPELRMIIDRDKHLYARSYTLLIDDLHSNINSFTRFGGKTILFNPESPDLDEITKILKRHVDLEESGV